MSSATIRLRAVRGAYATTWHGVIAGIPLHSNVALPLLDALAVSDPDSVTEPLPAPSGASGRIDGALLDAPHPVRWQRGTHADDYCFADGTHVRMGQTGLGTDTCIELLQAGTLLQAVVCGPVLLTALAAHQRWCLHASAFVLPGQQDAWLALAGSGTGKSTLARIAAQCGGAAWCDDLSVVGSDAAGVMRLWPRYWQLKWPASAHWPATAPAACTIRGLLLLERGAHTLLQPVARPHAVQALVRGSVASRLWRSATLAAHLQACARLAAQLAPRILRLQVRNAPDDPHAAMLEACRQLETLP